MELDTNNHSVFLLYYHLVLVTKYRRQVIDDEISDYAKTTFLKEFQNRITLLLVEWNHDKDHVHIMFKAQPKTELTKFINAYKSASSRLIKRDFQESNNFFGKKCSGLKAFVF